jgi:retinol-binding protein 3
MNQKSNIVLLVLVIALPLAAQSPRPVTSDRAMKQALVDSLVSFLDRNYVFADKAKPIGASIRKQFRSGAYDKITDPEELATALTRDLLSASNDKHLRVRFGPEQIAMLRADTGDGKARPEDIRFARDQNFGFYKLERLPGNIGYLDLRGFVGTSMPGAGATAVAAMNFLANSRAIIFDLRRNGGGEPSMIQLLSSYLFASSEHLNDLRSRPENFTFQFWTLPYVPGPALPDVPVYVLASRNTFSGAEEFANNLRELKRATIVGETTGGGAHAGQGMILNDYFIMFMPTMQAINPVSKSNWEGTGVRPHIAVPADSALDVAHLLALDTVLKTAADPRSQAELRTAIQIKQARMQPAVVPETTLKSCAGSYGIRTIAFENGTLIFQRENGPRLKLLPVSDMRFVLDETGGTVTFTSDANGKVDGFDLVRAQGDTVHCPRQ